MIDDLYTVFARYPLKEIEYCTCGCTDPALVRSLEEAPLRELAPATVADYAFSATFTIGDTDDLRHFLPRILELMREQNVLWLDPETVTGKLAYNGWRTWPADEQAAIEAFLDRWWQEALQADEEHAAQVLCAIGRAVDDLGPYLRQWRPIPGVEDRTLLLDNPFWDDREEQRAQVGRWLEGQQ